MDKRTCSAWRSIDRSSGWSAAGAAGRFRDRATVTRRRPGRRRAAFYPPAGLVLDDRSNSPDPTKGFALALCFWNGTRSSLHMRFLGTSSDVSFDGVVISPESRSNLHPSMASRLKPQSLRLVRFRSSNGTCRSCIIG